MQGVFMAPVTILIEFQAGLVVTTILLGRVITFLALGASKVNDDSDVLLCHANLFSGR